MKTTKLTIKILILAIVFSLFPIQTPKVYAAGKLAKVSINNLGLVGRWSLDGTDTTWTSATAGTTADTSGQGNTGTLTNMSRTTSPAAGKIGQGFNFDGNDDRVTMGSNLIGTGDITVCGWMNTTSLSVWQSIVGNNSFSFGPYSTGNRIIFTGDAGSTFIFSANNSITANQWYHVCALRPSSGNSSIYIDGSLSGTPGSIGSPTFPQEMAIGDLSSTGGGLPFSGKIDEVRLYNRILSSTEINNLYNSGVAKVGKLKGTPTELSSGSQRATQLGITAASDTLAFPGSVTAGNLLIVAGAVFKSPAVSTSIAVSDTRGTNYTVVLGTVLATTQRSFIAYGIAPSSGANTVTVDPNNDNATMSYSIDEFSGIDTSSPLSVNGGVTQGTGTSIADSITTVLPNELIIGVLTHDDTTQTLTPAANYTQIGEEESNASSQAHNAVYRLAATPTTYSVGWTVGVGNGNFEAQTLSFKPANVSLKVNSTQNNVLTNGLVGLWSFNGADMNWATGTAFDRSGQGNNGTITNMSTSTSPTAGKIGQALSFDGVNDFVSVPTHASLNPAQITISFWIKLPANVADINASILENDGNTGYRIRCSALTPCDPQFIFNGTFGADGTTIPLNTWTHVVVVGNSSGTRIYTNGVAGTLDTDPYVASAGGNFLMGNGALGYLNGILDEVRLYNRVLTPSEITQLYNAGR